MRLLAINLAQKHKRLPAPRKILLGTFVLIALILTWTVYAWAFTAVQIQVDGKEIALNSTSQTVAEALEKAGVTVGPKDLVTPGQATELIEGLTIKVARATDVFITADGKTWKIKSTPTTVKAALAGNNITLGTMDKVIPALETKISAGMNIKVVRVIEKVASEKVTLAFKIETVSDKKLDVGNRRVVRKGSNGVSERVWRVLLEDGKEVNRTFVSQKVVRQPVSQQIAMGARDTRRVSRYGTIRYSRVMMMSASAYTYTGNNMATGKAPFRGAVAVDPRVIPFGTRLYIEGYGPAVAADRGGDITGNRIDLFMESRNQALNWGLRRVKVYVLK